jgi:hypothetical protein
MRSNGARSAFFQFTSPLPVEWSPARAPCHRTWRKAVCSSHCPFRSLLVPSIHFVFSIYFPQISECRIVQQISQARLPRITSRNVDYIRTSEVKSFFGVDTSTRCGSIIIGYVDLSPKQVIVLPEYPVQPTHVDVVSVQSKKELGRSNRCHTSSKYEEFPLWPFCGPYILRNRCIDSLDSKRDPILSLYEKQHEARIPARPVS